MLAAVLPHAQASGSSVNNLVGCFAALPCPDLLHEHAAAQASLVPSKAVPTVAPKEDTEPASSTMWSCLGLPENAHGRAGCRCTGGAAGRERRRRPALHQRRQVMDHGHARRCADHSAAHPSISLCMCSWLPAALAAPFPMCKVSREMRRKPFLGDHVVEPYDIYKYAGNAWGAPRATCLLLASLSRKREQ